MKRKKAKRIAISLLSVILIGGLLVVQMQFSRATGSIQGSNEQALEDLLTNRSYIVDALSVGARAEEDYGSIDFSKNPHLASGVSDHFLYEDVLNNYEQDKMYKTLVDFYYQKSLFEDYPMETLLSASKDFSSFTVYINQIYAGADAVNQAIGKCYESLGGKFPIDLLYEQVLEKKNTEEGWTDYPLTGIESVRAHSKAYDEYKTELSKSQDNRDRTVYNMLISAESTCYKSGTGFLLQISDILQQFRPRKETTDAGEIFREADIYDAIMTDLFTADYQSTIGIGMNQDADAKAAFEQWDQILQNGEEAMAYVKQAMSGLQADSEKVLIDDYLDLIMEASESKKEDLDRVLKGIGDNGSVAFSADKSSYTLELLTDSSKMPEDEALAAIKKQCQEDYFLSTNTKKAADILSKSFDYTNKTLANYYLLDTMVREQDTMRGILSRTSKSAADDQAYQLMSSRLQKMLELSADNPDCQIFTSILATAGEMGKGALQDMTSDQINNEIKRGLMNLSSDTVTRTKIAQTASSVSTVLGLVDLFEPYVSDYGEAAKRIYELKYSLEIQQYVMDTYKNDLEAYRSAKASGAANSNELAGYVLDDLQFLKQIKLRQVDVGYKLMSHMQNETLAGWVASWLDQYGGDTTLDDIYKNQMDALVQMPIFPISATPLMLKGGSLTIKKGYLPDNSAYYYGELTQGGKKVARIAEIDRYMASGIGGGTVVIDCDITIPAVNGTLDLSATEGHAINIGYVNGEVKTSQDYHVFGSYIGTLNHSDANAEIDKDLECGSVAIRNGNLTVKGNLTATYTFIADRSNVLIENDFSYTGTGLVVNMSGTIPYPSGYNLRNNTTCTVKGSVFIDTIDSGIQDPDYAFAGDSTSKFILDSEDAEDIYFAMKNTAGGANQEQYVCYEVENTVIRSKVLKSCPNLWMKHVEIPQDGLTIQGDVNLYYMPYGREIEDRTITVEGNMAVPEINRDIWTEAGAIHVMKNLTVDTDVNFRVLTVDGNVTVNNSEFNVYKGKYNGDVKCTGDHASFQNWNGEIKNNMQLSQGARIFDYLHRYGEFSWSQMAASLTVQGDCILEEGTNTELKFLEVNGELMQAGGGTIQDSYAGGNVSLKNPECSVSNLTIKENEADTNIPDVSMEEGCKVDSLTLENDRITSQSGIECRDLNIPATIEKVSVEGDIPRLLVSGEHKSGELVVEGNVDNLSFKDYCSLTIRGNAVVNGGKLGMNSDQGISMDEWDRHLLIEGNLTLENGAEYNAGFSNSNSDFGFTDVVQIDGDIYFSNPSMLKVGRDTTLKGGVKQLDDGVVNTAKIYVACEIGGDVYIRNGSCSLSGKFGGNVIIDEGVDASSTTSVYLLGTGKRILQIPTTMKMLDIGQCDLECNGTLATDYLKMGKESAMLTGTPKQITIRNIENWYDEDKGCAINPKLILENMTKLPEMDLRGSVACNITRIDKDTNGQNIWDMEISNYDHIYKVQYITDGKVVYSLPKVVEGSKLIPFTDENGQELTWYEDIQLTKAFDFNNEVVTKNLNLMSDGNAKILTSENTEINVTDCEYTGEAVTPKITVKYDGVTLIPEQDYLVKVFNNVDICPLQDPTDATSPYVKITGTGDYCGVVEQYFAITKVKQVVEIEKKEVKLDCETYYYLENILGITYKLPYRFNPQYDFNITILNGVENDWNIMWDRYYNCHTFGSPKTPQKVTFRISVQESSYWEANEQTVDVIVQGYYPPERPDTVTVPNNIKTVGEVVLNDRWKIKDSYLEKPLNVNELVYVEADYIGEDAYLYKTTTVTFAIIRTEELSCEHPENARELRNALDATCTENGYTGDTYCTNCGELISSGQSEEALGHDYSEEWTTDQEPSCTEKGEKSRHCKRCPEKTEVKEIAELGHSWEDGTITKVPTCTEDGLIIYPCTRCNEQKEKSMPATGHDRTEVKQAATLDSNGKIVEECNTCGVTINSKIIYYPKTISLEDTSFVYDGSKQTPAVTVKDVNGNTLVKDTDYTVSYASGRTDVGTYKVTVTFKGNYTGSKPLSFKIVPKATTTKLSLYGHDDVKVSWKKVDQADGYKVYYRKTGTSSWTTKGYYTGTSVTLPNLVDGTKYEVAVRPYKTVGTTKYYAAYTPVSIYTLKATTTKLSLYGHDDVKVTWSDIYGESGYKVYYRKAGAKSWTTKGYYTGTSVTLPNLADGARYEVAVRPYKTVGTTKYYAPYKTASIYTLKATTTKLSLYGYDDVKVTWSNIYGESGYKVFYRKSGTTSWTTKGYYTGTSVTLSNLADGAKYEVAVRPYKIVNNTKIYAPYKTASIYTLKRVYTPKVSRYGSKIKVTWSNIAGESGYQISQSTSKTGTKVVSTYNTTSGRYRYVTATKGKYYYYKVRAYRTVGTKRIYGPWSTAVSYKR